MPGFLLLVSDTTTANVSFCTSPMVLAAIALIKLRVRFNSRYHLFLVYFLSLPDIYLLSFHFHFEIYYFRFRLSILFRNCERHRKIMRIPLGTTYSSTETTGDTCCQFQDESKKIIQSLLVPNYSKWIRETERNN